MVLLNTNQIIPGARTKGGVKTYVISVHKEAPAITNSTPVVDFTAGSVEFDGVNFTLPDLDLTNYHTFLVSGDYKILAVPKYEEPADIASAEGANINYYVNYTSLNEALVHYFLPTQLVADVNAAGGYNSLTQKVNYGSETAAERVLWDSYSEELVKLTDPRYTGKLIEPVGVEYILQRVFPQDNTSKDDALATMTESELRIFLAQQGHVPARWVVDTVANQGTAFDAILSKVKRAFAYLSVTDANSRVNGLEVRLNEGDTLTAPVDLEGNTITVGVGNYTHIGLFEYYQPTVMSRGHEGMQDGIFDLYTKEQATELGRVNPLYMARDNEVARVSAGKGMPLNALTKYADPLVVAEMTLTVVPSTSVTVDSVTPAVGKLLDLV